MHTCAHTKARIHTHAHTWHMYASHVHFLYMSMCLTCLHFVNVPSQSCRTKAAWVTAQDFVRRKTKGGKRLGGRSGEMRERSRRRKKKKKKRKMELRTQ